MNTTTPPFLALPPEVRARIYHYASLPLHLHWLLRYSSPNQHQILRPLLLTTPRPSLLLINHFIHDEAAPILYATATIHLTHLSFHNNHLIASLPPHLHLIRRLSLANIISVPTTTSPLSLSSLFPQLTHLTIALNTAPSATTLLPPPTAQAEKEMLHCIFNRLVHREKKEPPLFISEMAQSFTDYAERDWILDLLEGYTALRAAREEVTASRSASPPHQQLRRIAPYIPRHLSSVSLTVDLTRALRSREIGNEYEDARAVKRVTGTYSVETEMWVFEVEVRDWSRNLRPGVVVVEVPEELEESLFEGEDDEDANGSGSKG
jgi:hypothetical protein